MSGDTFLDFVPLGAMFGVAFGSILLLVLVSLSFAVIIAVPLGVLAYTRPQFGGLILGIVGVIQTIPSMALLVFMIPLLGLGLWPALVALLLYSLLPIVRNTNSVRHGSC